MIEKIDSIGKKIKNNLAIIILIPTILGGIWQTFELFFIDLSFIRFFSPTQLISDGIVILSILSILFLLYFISKKYIFKSFFKIDLKETKFDLSRFIFAIIIAIASVAYFLFAIKKTRLLDNNFSINIIILLIILLIICVPMFFYALREIFIEIISWEVKRFNSILLKISVMFLRKPHLYSKVRRYTGNLFSALLFIIIFVSFFGLIKFRYLLIYPEKFENIKFVFYKVHKDFGKNVKPSLLYFNDKYLFIEIESINKFSGDQEVGIKEKPIVIYRTEDVLFHK